MDYPGPDKKGSLPWELSDHIGNLLKRASIAVRREIEQTLRPYGLTPQQYIAMRYMADMPGITHSDVERLMRIEKPSVTSLVVGLEKKGWIVRKPHGEDARIKQIYLTAAGHAICDSVHEQVERVKNRVEEHLSPEEATILRVLLKKVIAAYNE